MSEARDRTEAQDDDPGHADAASLHPDSLRSSLILLQQDIDQLECLRQDYRQIQSTLEQLWCRISEREAQVSRRLNAAVATVMNTEERSASGNASAVPVSPIGDAAPGPVLHVHALGNFSVLFHDLEICLGSSKKGRAVFRYLVTQSERRAGKDVLLELFWPGEDPDVASHKLHIAISTLRRALQRGLADETREAPPFAEAILYQDDCYGLHPALGVRLDVDAFVAHVWAGEQWERQGRTAEAVVEYQLAADLYRGDFLTEDLYADWAIAPRARLEEMYLTLLGRLATAYLADARYTDCVSCCRRILLRDSYREDAYRLIMRCYSRMGQRNRALREFSACTEVLKRELGVQPMRETLELRDRIAREEAV
jgi:DNA-binding SARP family transcriptional activator